MTNRFSLKLKLIAGAAIAASAVTYYVKNDSPHPDEKEHVKAIYEYSPENGMKIRDEASKNIGLEFSTFEGSQTQNIPSSALVKFKNKVGVYRLRDGWLKLVEVEIIKKQAAAMLISSNELKVGDQITISGVALLRVSELDVEGGSE